MPKALYSWVEYWQGVNKSSSDTDQEVKHWLSNGDGYYTLLFGLPALLRGFVTKMIGEKGRHGKYKVDIISITLLSMQS